MNLAELSQIEDNSLVNINIPDIDKYDSSLEDVVSKLRYNGRLSFNGVDYKELGRMAFLGSITEKEFNDIVCLRFSISCIESVLAECMRLNLKVIEKSFDGYKYNLVVERVKNV